MQARSDPFGLERFVRAQERIFDQARCELRQGRKATHWMWFVFPQLRGLGHSPTARHYALASLEEAQAYLAHPILGPRLIECTALVNAVQGQPIQQIVGCPDDLKFHSCVTLFSLLPGAPPLFKDALRRYFDGVPDRLTMQALGR